MRDAPLLADVKKEVIWGYIPSEFFPKVSDAFEKKMAECMEPIKPVFKDFTDSLVALDKFGIKQKGLTPDLMFRMIDEAVDYGKKGDITEFTIMAAELKEGGVESNNVAKKVKDRESEIRFAASVASDEDKIDLVWSMKKLGIKYDGKKDGEALKKALDAQKDILEYTKYAAKLHEIGVDVTEDIRRKKILIETEREKMVQEERWMDYVKISANMKTLQNCMGDANTKSLPPLKEF